jgi:hypothetical protein
VLLFLKLVRGSFEFEFEFESVALQGGTFTQFSCCSRIVTMGRALAKDGFTRPI